MIDPRISQYESLHRCRLLGPLGQGVGQDGFVQRSDRLTAVKFFDKPERFRRELEVYRIFQTKEINLIAGHNVPELISASEDLQTIEMTIVERPFLLDFAGAKYPSEAYDFDQHILDDYFDALRDKFDERWADALHVAAVFEQITGMKYYDLHPGNVAFIEP